MIIMALVTTFMTAPLIDWIDSGKKARQPYFTATTNPSALPPP